MPNWLKAWSTVVRCLVGLHEPTREFENKSMYLRCMHCGRRTAGWVVDGPAPTMTAPRLPDAIQVIPMEAALEAVPEMPFPLTPDPPGSRPVIH